MKEFLKLQNVNITYKKNYYALLNFSYKFKSGFNYFISGEEQSGKSTLCRFIAGLEKKYSGKIFLDDKQINLKDLFYKSEIGFIFNCGVFIESKTVAENLKYAFYLRNGENESFDIDKVLSNFAIQHLKDIKVKKLTKIDRLIVCLARLSLRNLSILIIDDIFEGLNKDEIKNFLCFVKDNLNYKILIISNQYFIDSCSILGCFENLKMKAGFLDV